MIYLKRIEWWDMNMNYLLSILDLYLLKENNNPLIIELINNNNIVKFELSYLNSYEDKTYIKLDKEIFFKDIKYFLDKIQSNLDIKSESIDNNIYNITFSNNRKINFINFDVKDIELIRNNLNHTNYELMFKENKTETYNEILKENKSNQKLAFSMGFSGFITIFLTAIWFLDIFMIALWIFKIVM